MSSPVTIKGNGSILEFWMDNEYSYTELRDALIKRLDVNAAFYIGSRRPVIFYGKSLTEAQKRELRNFLMTEYSFNHISFVDDELPEPPVSDKTPQIKEPSAQPAPVLYPPDVPEPSEIDESKSDIKHIFINQTVRSGQRIETSGDITVIGDVNPGAELIAGGSIAVFGRLSGLVHAGAYGREDVIIAASRLRAKQIRICSRIAMLPDTHKPECAETVRYKNGQMVISSLSQK